MDDQTQVQPQEGAQVASEQAAEAGQPLVTTTEPSSPETVVTQVEEQPQVEQPASEAAPADPSVVKEKTAEEVFIEKYNALVAETKLQYSVLPKFVPQGENSFALRFDLVLSPAE